MTPPRMSHVKPGDRIRVKQKVTVGQRSWALEVSGIVLEVKPIPTGIHADRVPQEEVCVESALLEKPDRELCRVTFDENTQVEILSRGPLTPGPSPPRGQG